MQGIDFGKYLWPVYTTMISILSGYLWSKYQKITEENKRLKEQKKRETDATLQAIVKAVRFLMFGSLQELYSNISQKETITTEDKQKWDDAFSIYKDGLGGDGAGDSYNNYIQSKVVHDHKLN